MRTVFVARKDALLSVMAVAKLSISSRSVCTATVAESTTLGATVEADFGVDWE